VLLTAVTEDALNCVSGVFVGLGVSVGGTRKKGVFVSNGVKVGRGVLLGVTSSVELAVQVAADCMGGTVKITDPRETGGNKLKDEFGLTKINKKYKPMQAVITSTRIESISHISNRALCESAFCFPSKSKLSSIQFIPLSRGEIENLIIRRRAGERESRINHLGGEIKNPSIYDLRFVIDDYPFRISAPLNVRITFHIPPRWNRDCMPS